MSFRIHLLSVDQADNLLSLFYVTTRLPTKMNTTYIRLHPQIHPVKYVQFTHDFTMSLGFFSCDFPNKPIASFFLPRNSR